MRALKPGWRTWLLPQIGYYRFHADLTPKDPYDLTVLADNAHEFRESIGTYGRHQVEELRQWLLEFGLTSEDDEEHFRWAQSADNALPVFRVGCCVGRIWPWEHAVALDDSGDLVREVSEALNELMEALGERARF